MFQIKWFTDKNGCDSHNHLSTSEQPMKQFLPLVNKWWNWDPETLRNRKKSPSCQETGPGIKGTAIPTPQTHLSVCVSVCFFLFLSLCMCVCVGKSVSLSLSELFTFILWVWVFCQHVCMCTTYMPGTCRGQKRALDFLELELWMVEICQVGPGNWTWDLWKSSKCF